jgi:hypothetical protein
MKSNVVIARNLLVGAGAYYLSKWLVVPLALGFGKMTQGLIYSGEFNGKIVAPVFGKRAVVAVARKLAILLHRLWVSGEVYEPLRNSEKAMRAVA